MATETGEGAADADEVSETDDTGEEFDPHLRSITVTTTATLLGIVAGVASMLFATAEGTPPQPDNTLGFGILAGAVVLQFPLYQAVGIDIREFETKDQVYIFFMTFVTWFISWSVLMTTGAL
jgi:hypothetical protein